MPETNRNLCTKVIALLKGLMIYNTWDRDRDNFSLRFYVSTFIPPPPHLQPPDPLAGPQFLIGPLRPSSWPLDPSAGLLTLQLAFQKLWLPS